jgi:hypothetical protein
MSYPIMMMIAQVLVRSMVVWIHLYELRRRAHILNGCERTGMGLSAGCFFMTIPVYMDIHRDGTPFDQWAALGVAVGVLVHTIGREIRFRGHERRNMQQVSEAHVHLTGRGKI